VRAAECHRAPRRDHRRRRTQRASDHRRDRAGHDPLPHARAPGGVGQAVPAHHPVRARHPRRPHRQGQPLPERRARPGRRRGRAHRHLSSASATAASSSAAASSRPWLRSPAPSWSSSGTCSPTPSPGSMTSDPTTTPAASTSNAACVTTSPSSPPSATGSPSNPPPDPNTQLRNVTRLRKPRRVLSRIWSPRVIYRTVARPLEDVAHRPDVHALNRSPHGTGCTVVVLYEGGEQQGVAAAMEQQLARHADA
jgi:hypothetical protein